MNQPASSPLPAILAFGVIVGGIVGTVWFALWTPQPPRSHLGDYYTTDFRIGVSVIVASLAATCAFAIAALIWKLIRRKDD